MANNHIWQQWQDGDHITSEALNDIESRITTLTNNVNYDNSKPSIQHQINALNVNIGGSTSLDLNTVYGVINTNKINIRTLQDYINSINSDLGILTNRADNNDVMHSEIQSQIQGLLTTTETNRALITNLTNNVNYDHNKPPIQRQINILNDVIDNININIIGSRNSSDLNTVYGAINRNKNNIESLQNQTNSINDNLTALSSSVSDNSRAINTIKDSIIGYDSNNQLSIQGQINLINNQINYNIERNTSIQEQIDNNHSDIVILDGLITSINTQLTSLSSDIADFNETKENIDSLIQQAEDNAISAAQTAVTEQINALMSDTIQPALNTVTNATSALNDMMTSATSAIEAGLSEISSAQSEITDQINELLLYLLGNSTIPTTYNETVLQYIIGQASSAAATATTQLTSAISNIQSIIDDDTQNRLYDLNAGLSTGQDSIRARLDDLSSSIDSLNSAIGNSEDGGSIISQINALNEAIFGVGGAGSSELSLLQKIEAMVGRSLELSSGEQLSSGEYEHSVMSYIRELQGVLGLDGGSVSSSTSSLVNDVLTLQSSVETISNDLYHNVNFPNTTLPAAVVGIYNDILTISSANTEIQTAIEGYADEFTRLEDAYIGSEIEQIQDKYYLILKTDLEEANATTVDDISEKTNTYLELPATGGGGGGPTYDLTASFTNVVFPTNTTINVGDNCPVTFTWSVVDEAERAQSISGTLVLKVNNTTYLTEIIDSGTSHTINVGQYISNTGRNTVVISVSSEQTLTKNLYLTITAYNATLTSSFDQNIIQTGSSIIYPYLASIGTVTIPKVLHVLIDGVELTLTGNTTTTEQQNTISFNTPSAGSHLMQVYFTAQISESLTLTSNILNYGIICGSAIGTRIASNFVNGSNIEQYNILTLRYLVVTTNQDTSPIAIYINNSATPIFTGTVTPTYQDWSYQVTQASGTILTITLVSGSASLTLTANVVQSMDVPAGAFDLNSSGLQLYLTPDQRSNQSANKNIWTNSSPEANAPEVDVTMSNFLYYGTVDGWQQDEDGAYFLRLRNQARVIIDYPIFNFTRIDNKISSGCTFEIDFHTQDVADVGTLICQCFEGTQLVTGSSYKYITLTPQNATLMNTVELNTQYKEDEKITLDFVVQPSNLRTNENHLIYVYINGVLSGVVSYAEDANLSFSNVENGKIVLGSSECTLDIYSIKIYNRALTYKEIIGNWINGTPKFEEKVTRFKRNNYPILANSTRANVTIDLFRTNSPTTPYMIITGKGPLTDENAMPQYKGSDYAKTVNVQYVDPVNPELSFEAESFDVVNATGSAKAQVQGTSSQAYFRKNYKIKLASFTQNGIFHIKSPGDEYYDIVIDEQTGDEISRTLKENVTKEGYKLRDTSYPEFTFCIKADVASSESVNNTGLVQIYDSAIRNQVLTPPQADDARIRQGVEGYPMVVWYKDSINNTETLLGRYNFNNDKGTNKVYGLKSSLDLDEDIANRDLEAVDGIYDESWELKNNDADTLLMFEVPSDPAAREAAWLGEVQNTDESITVNWQKSFESRFPDQDDEGIANINHTSTAAEKTYLNKRLAGLREVVEWVADNVQWTDNTKTAITTPNHINADAFKADFANYFNVPAMLFFYVFTELFLMVDNRAKNMFLTRYQVRPGKRPKANYTADVNTLEPYDYNYFGWFTFPYDFDTAIGTNNQGKNVYDYHWESLDVTGPDGSAIFGGQYSKLWVVFRQLFTNEIASMYSSMVGSINYNTVESLFERNQSIWSETITNEDMFVKYIDWGAAIGYNMLLGLKDMQRKWWLYNRFKYFNSKFAIERATDNIHIRIHNNYANIPVQVYADSYVSLSIGADSATPQSIIRVLRGQTGSLTVGQQGASGTDSSGIETYISPASSLKTVMNLSTFNLSSADFSHAIRLQSLQIGTPNENTPNTGFKTFIMDPKDSNNNPVTPLLRHLDLRNCSGLTGNLNLANCLFLNEVYLYGTTLSSVSLPNGGVLTTVQYPTTIDSIIIQNQPYLTNLIIGNAIPATEQDAADEAVNIPSTWTNDYSTINNLYLANIGTAIDSMAIVNEMDDDSHIHLEDVDWTISATDFFGENKFFSKISNMKGFDGTQPDSSPSYISGQLALTEATAQNGVTNENLLMVQERFPNLELVAKVGDEIRVYHRVVFMNFNNEVISTQIVVHGNTAIAPIFTDEDGGTSYITDDVGNRCSRLSYKYESTDTFGRVLEDYGTTVPNGIRKGFGGWDINYYSVEQALTIRPVAINEYRYIFYIDEGTTTRTETFYYPANISIRGPMQANNEHFNFTRTHYDYYWSGWSLTDGGEILSNWYLTVNYPRELYATYDLQPHNYVVRILNTDSSGNAYRYVNNELQYISSDLYLAGRAPEPLNQLNSTIIYKNAVDGGFYTTQITYSELSSYISDEHIYMIGATEDDNKPWSEKKYKFLNWAPYVDASTPYSIKGDTDILLMYYFEDDMFTNYFTDKLVTCELDNTVTSLPFGAFTHNLSLRRLDTYATDLGDYSFSNYTSANSPRQRVFIFQPTGDYTVETTTSGGDVTRNYTKYSNGTLRPTADMNFGEYSFYNLSNAVIILNTSGRINCAANAFSRVNNCTIICYSSEAIRGNESFVSFSTGINNTLLVSDTAYNEYRNADSLEIDVPASLRGNNAPQTFSNENVASILNNLEN